MLAQMLVRRSMTHDGMENCVMGLLKGEPESRRWLYERCAPKVLDAVPRDCVKPLETHDFFIQAEGLFAATHDQLQVLLWRLGPSLL